MAELSQDNFTKELNNLLRANQDTFKAIGKGVLHGIIDTYLLPGKVVPDREQQAEGKAVAAATV